MDIKFYCEDARKSFLEPGSVDLFITHPPFLNKLPNEHGGDSNLQIQNADTPEDFSKALVEFLKTMDVALKDDGAILLILPNTRVFFKILSDLEIKRKILFSEMKKNKKNEKREKLIKSDNYKEGFQKAKTTFENEEYNFKFNFYSIFTFTGGESKITSNFFIENKLYPNVWKFATGQSNNSLDSKTKAFVLAILSST